VVRQPRLIEDLDGIARRQRPQGSEIRGFHAAGRAAKRSGSLRSLRAT
jgi:hypothetical protein